jgi:predicted DNA-binding transcriptional regulator YafY
MQTVQSCTRLNEDTLRPDFRNFRFDRIASVRAVDDRYPDESRKRPEDYLRKMQAD